MNETRLLTIQDISCVGQCSLKAALPILSACGIETAVLPCALLSAHTAFPGATFHDLSGDMADIEEHWRRSDIRFDAFYTGYLGGAHQVERALSVIRSTGKSGGTVVVDPAMADHGKLYDGLDGTLVEAMAELCKRADYLLPNITEACLLAGMEYRESCDEGYLGELLRALGERFMGTVVLTGAGDRADTSGVAVHADGRTLYYRHPKSPQNFPGTGDVFASAFTGALLRGVGAYRAARLAADFTAACVEQTMKYPGHWYGVKFEPLLPRLIRTLEDHNKP